MYMRYITIAGDHKGIDTLIHDLSTNFRTKDLGKLRYFLDIEVKDQKGISLSQSKYTLVIMRDTCYLGAKPIATFVEINKKLNHNDLVAAQHY